MKKQLLTIALFLTSVSLFSQSTIWHPYNSNIDTVQGIRYLSVVDSNTVWGISEDGTFPLRTSNRFTRTQNGSTFTSGTFLPDTNFWAPGNISAVNDSTAFISLFNKGVNAGTGTGAGTVVKTTDRGLTWTIATDTNTMFTGGSNFPDWVHFYDNNNGIVLGDPNGGTPAYFEIYRTHNGGANWIRVPQANITANLSGDAGLTNSYTTYGSHIWFGTGKGRVYRSSDSGATWKAPAAAITGMGGGVQGLAFRDSLNGLCWGLTSAKKFTLRKTADGGVTWKAIYLRNNVGTNDICVIPGRNAYMSVGLDSAAALSTTGFANGIITSVTYDDGATWNVLENTASGPTAYEFNMLSVQMVDSMHGWAGNFSSDTLPLGTNGMNKFMGSAIALACPLTVTGLTSICAGKTTTLTAAGLDGYVWAPTSATTSTISVTPTTPTIYTITGTNPNCTITKTYTLNVNPIPTLNVTNDTVICALNSATLTASGTSTTYGWIPATTLSSSTGTTVVASPTTNTIYTVTGTANTCTTSATVTVTVNPCTGINKVSANSGISIFPNPSHGVVTVSVLNSQVETNLTITDVLGKEVYKTTIPANTKNTNLDLSNLYKGLYLMNISGGNSSQIQKIIIE